jgi:CubicO group peptidase (beta-lactamase class C family)
MSEKFCQTCRFFSFLTGFLLLLQVSFAQYNFGTADIWLKNNIADLGGRAVLMVYKDGKIIYTGIENNVSGRQKRITEFIARRKGKNADEMLEDLTTTSRLRIASCSKWLSAALVMTFVDEGKLSLEDSVGKYLPVMTAYGKGNIRIWECLSHLTGINSGSLKESLEAMKDIHSMDEAIQKIAEEPMEGEPGKSFHYSNTGLQIAAAVIEKISGISFEELFAERIASPCSMTNTDFGHTRVPLPAGGAYSTPQDYMNFLTMILNKGSLNGKQILSPAAILKMQQDHAKDAKVAYSPAEAVGWGYGFGEWIIKENSQPVDAVSSPGLFGSFPWVDNKRKYAAFLFCFNLKNKGRNQKYIELKGLIDETIDRGH